MAHNILGEWTNGTRDFIGDRVVQDTRTVYGVQVYGLVAPPVGIPVPILTAVQENGNIRISWTYPA